MICRSRAVRREMRCVRLGFATLCCPSFMALMRICTICWASSSLRLRSSVGWSAGTMPWSGASWKDVHWCLTQGSLTHLFPYSFLTNKKKKNMLELSDTAIKYFKFKCKRAFSLTSQQYCWTSWRTLFRSLFSCSSSSTVVAYRFWKSRSIGIEYDFWTQNKNIAEVSLMWIFQKHLTCFKVT